jgi:ubiquinone/menaquinone biosynthesis C-methylase UbiE
MSSERQLLEEKSPWWGEHLHRYYEVIKHLKGDEIILDIACGTGYGTHLLSTKCKSIIGGDIEREIIETNLNCWTNKNCAFTQMDGTKLPYDDGAFDVLVSFETIEHTVDYLKMLSEFKRVVKKGGLLFISTPNFYLNSPDGVIVNKFHTQEFTPEEFDAILKLMFSEYKIFGQLYIRYEERNKVIHRLAKLTEWIFYLRGFRKLPLNFKDNIMKILIKKNFYPDISDYILTEDKDLLTKKCITQIAIIKNN